MNISDTFKDTIKEVFYDKEIDLYDVTADADDEGFQRKGEPATKTGSFYGNIQFDKLDQIAEEYGLDQEIHATITTDEVISLNQVIGYGGRFYTVIEAIQNDSHYFLIAQKCLLRSTISLSA